VKKAYLFVYNDGVGDRETVKNIINTMPEISRWRYDMPNCFYIISEYSARELSTKFRSITGKKGRFVFVEFAGNDQGFLPEQSWYLITNKKYMPKK
jgi:hypothetical protein